MKYCEICGAQDHMSSQCSQVQPQPISPSPAVRGAHERIDALEKLVGKHLRLHEAHSPDPFVSLPSQTKALLEILLMALVEQWRANEPHPDFGCRPEHQVKTHQEAVSKLNECLSEAVQEYVGALK